MSNMPAIIKSFEVIQKPETYRDIVNCPSPKFKPFIAQYGVEPLKALICKVIMEAANMLRFDTSPDMISGAAELIITDFPDTKLSDLKMFKDDIIRGKVGGKLFGFDSRNIYECWKEYYALREDVFAEDREEKYQEQKKEYNEAWGRMAMPEKYAILRKAGEDRTSLKAYQANTSNMSLERICEEYGVSFETVKKNAEKDCAEAWTEDSGVDFEWYVEWHLKSVLMHVRKCYENLLQYAK